MQTLSEIRALLEENGLAPNKALGQNFLIDQNLIRRLVEASGVGARDLVLEVGPGTGALTDALLERGAETIACELDAGLADLLTRRYERQIESGQFRLIRGDCLASKAEMNPGIEQALAGRAFRLVANLPYGAASPLMAILATRHAPSLAPAAGRAACLGQFVTIQREVGARLRAAPGESEYGELGVLAQAMCEVKRLATLAPECFWPRPKVTSEMVALVPRAEPLTRDPDRLAALCRRLFTKRRKQLGTILGREAIPAWLDATRRPESLTVQEFVRLAGEVALSDDDR